MVIARAVNTPTAWSERALTIRDPWEACGWSKESQEIRFSEVLWALDPKPGERLLDYGCGTGEFSEWLPASVSYTGYDTAPGMVLRAARDHWKEHRAFTPLLPPHRYDLIAAIGCWNLNQHWSKQRTWHMIRHLWDTTGCRALAVCLYAGDDRQCIHYREDEIEGCARDLSCDYQIVETLPNDLMLVSRR